MKPLDCDGVFEVLTRGPFPTGDASDATVEQHLRCCYECRSLAEALRPAVELLHEAIDAEECRDLPGYQGTLAPTQYSYSTRPSVAQMVMAAIEAETETVKAPAKAIVRRATWWERLVVDRYRFATAMAAGALLAFICWSLNTDATPERMTTATRPARFAPSDQGMLTLAAMRLPAGCFPSTEPTAQAAHTWHCCTECHASTKGTASPSPAMLLAVVQSCRACHP